MMYVVFMKNFFLADSSKLLAVRHDDSYVEFMKNFHLAFVQNKLMYVEFMKNFHLACSNNLISVRLISAISAQKRLIPTF